jgi:hypothetical protein
LTFSTFCGKVVEKVIGQSSGNIANALKTAKQSLNGLLNDAFAIENRIIPHSGIGRVVSAFERVDGRRFLPFLACFNSPSIISMLCIIGKFIQHFTRKIRALPAMLMPAPFTAGFYRTGFAPKRLINRNTTLTSCLFAIFTLAAN